MNIDFSKAVVGQSIYSPEYGEGEIVAIGAVRVGFSGEEELGVKVRYKLRGAIDKEYKYSGKFGSFHNHPSLFHDKREWQDYVASTREEKIDKLFKGLNLGCFSRD